MVDRQPPHDLDAEAAVLGAMLMGHVDVALSLAPTDFYYPPHARVFDAIVSLHAEGEPVDQVTAASRLPREDRALVLDLASNYLPSGLEAHVRMVKALSRRRATIAECRRIESIAYEEDAVDDAMQAFMRLTDSGDKQSESIVDLAQNRLDTMRDRRPYFTPPGGGPHFKAGNFIVVGGRPGTGKSALALWWALEWSKVMRVALYSYEMDGEEVADRIISNKTGTPIEVLDEGFSDSEIETYRRHMGDLKRHKLSVKVAAGLSTAQLYSSLRTFRAGGGQVAIIDYIQLAMEHTKQGDTADLTRLSNGLRRLALDTGLVIIALSQFNRGMEGRTGKDAYPRLSDFRQSGSLEQDATAALLLYRYPDGDEGRDARGQLREKGWQFDPNDERTLLRCEWAKVRQGKPHVRMLMFDGSAMRFEEVHQT